MDPEQHLQVEPRPFALRDELRHAARHAPDLLEVACRRRQVHHGPVLGVRHGDHRRHHAGSVTEPLEDAERPLEDLCRIEDQRRDRQPEQEFLDADPGRQHGQELVSPAGEDLGCEPRAPACEVDHPDLTKGRGEAPIVVQPLGERDRGAVGLLGAVEVGLARGTAERLAERAPQERLAELEGRPKLGRGVALLGGSGADAASELRGRFLVVARPERRRTPQLDIELDLGIAHRFGEGGELGEAVEPLARLPEDRERIVARREQDPPVGGRRDDREGLLDESERLLRGIGGEGGRRGVDREARRPRGVAGRERVLGEHRQSGRGRVAALQQQVDDGGMDLPASRRGQLVRRELADLFVGERVVRGLSLRLRQQEAGAHRGAEIVRQRIRTVADASCVARGCPPQRPARGTPPPARSRHHRLGPGSLAGRAG